MTLLECATAGCITCRALVKQAHGVAPPDIKLHGPAPHRAVKDHINLTADYLQEAFDLDTVTARITNLLRGVEYDTLVGTGLSGSLVVPHLAHTFGKHYAIVRKSDHHSGDHDNSHSSKPVEGRLGRRWVFVDDLVSSGATQRRVIEAVSAVAGGSWQTVYVGMVLYRDGRYVPAEEDKP